MERIKLGVKVDSIRLDGGKKRLVKIAGDEEWGVASGYMICLVAPEDGDESSINLLKLDRCVMVGSLSSRDFMRTSLVQEIVEHNVKGNYVVFATLNSLYRIEDLYKEDLSSDV